MNQERQKKVALGGVLVLGLFLGLALNSSNTGNSGSSLEDRSWQEVNLTDVRNGEQFTVAELDKPVLIETFAVWCTTCTRQQQEIKKLHGEVNFTSVSLNVDPNEGESKIRNHIQREGFDWRYAISPIQMTNTLREEYDNTIANPPSAPVILVCENETRRLQNGVKPASKLEEEIRRGCTTQDSEAAARSGSGAVS